MRREQIGWNGGVLVDTGSHRFLFDPASSRLSAGRNVFITHAHSDHTQGFGAHASKCSTRETRLLYEALTEKQVQHWTPLDVGDRLRTDDVEITSLNAGHILGSCQFRVATPEFTAIYTGDINCVDTLTTHSATPEPCDYLIIEATYGHPAYRFPSRSTVYADIVRWTMTEISDRKVPTFQVYSSGKPQELVKLFNKYTKIPVVCSPKIARTNSVYNKSGSKLEYNDDSTKQGQRMLKRGECVHITTARKVNISPKASRAVTTGWALSQAFQSYASFPLSSHADYDQLMAFVASARPRKVYIFTGHATPLAHHIRRRLNIEASALPMIAQTKLADFYGFPSDDYEKHTAS